MSKFCLYLTFALVLCLFAATSLANPKPDAGIEIIINKAKSGTMNKAMPKVVGRRLKKMMKGARWISPVAKSKCFFCCTDPCRLYPDTWDQTYWDNYSDLPPYQY